MATIPKSNMQGGQRWRDMEGSLKRDGLVRGPGAGAGIARKPRKPKGAARKPLVFG